MHCHGKNFYIVNQSKIIVGMTFEIVNQQIYHIR